MRKAAGILALIALSGCAVQRAQVANEAREQMVGLTKEQVLACMGPPANRMAEGATEVWAYNSGNGRTTISTSGEAVRTGPGNISTSSTGIATQRACTVNVVMASGRVSKVNYSGPTGGLLTGGEQCAYAVSNCAQ